MKSTDLKKALACAVHAARQAGALIRRHHGVKKKINARTRHDIKLALDVQCEKLIDAILLAAFPDSGVLGEEGISGKAGQPLRWVVDPIDGTVNFTYGIPHACVSIALQERAETTGQDQHAAPLPPGKFQIPSPHEVGRGLGRGVRSLQRAQSQNAPAQYTTVVGAVYDPFSDELWTATSTTPARLNGKIIHASQRTKLEETIVSIGFAKDSESLWKNLPVFNALVRRVMKMRMMGSAALSLAYVASGRFDAYLESGIRLWDIAAAGFILERAGGEFWRRELPGSDKYQMLANNGLLRQKIERIARAARKQAPAMHSEEQYGKTLTDEEIEQNARVAFQALDREEKRAGLR